MKNWIFAILSLPFVASGAFAQPHVLKAAAIPEPGILLALGSGLVGLATVIRRRFSQ